MPYPRRPAVKKKDDLGRLMVTLRTRDKIWVPCDPEGARALMEKLMILIADATPTTLVEFSAIIAFARVEAIEGVQYFPKEKKKGSA